MYVPRSNDPRSLKINKLAVENLPLGFDTVGEMSKLRRKRSASIAINWHTIQ